MQQWQQIVSGMVSKSPSGKAGIEGMSTEAKDN